MKLRDLRINSGAGRVLLVAPVWLMLAGVALARVFDLDLFGAASRELLFGFVLLAIAGYGFLAWRVTMNEHEAHQDDLMNG